HDRAAWTFLQSAMEIANLMDISFIAEGIEDEAGLTLARRAGVEIVQGFYLARPMSGDDLVGFVPQPLALRSAVA
ncbi:MAG: EAL domain-containing protein, partial [Pseudomonadota bacterium]